MATDPEIEQSRLTRFLGFRITRAKIRVHKVLMTCLSAHGLNSTEFSVLVLASANPGAYLRQLSSALHVSPPNLVSVIERLVKRDLLTRSTGSEDRRLQELHLTKAGQALLKKAEADVERFEHALEQSLTATERRHIDSALGKLAHFRLDP